MINDIKQARLNNKFTQQQASDFLGISLRSYKMYENNDNKKDSIKYKYILDKLKENCEINENKGILEFNDIKTIVADVFKDYKIDYCYLFGPYAKNIAKEDSDVDLLVSTDLKGIKFYELIEKLRQGLHKNIDLLDINQLNNNVELINEILKDGIKIYG